MNTSDQQFLQMYNGLRNFLTLPGEKLLFAKRKHFLILLMPICMIILMFFVILSILFVFVGLFLPSEYKVLIGINSLFLLVSVSLIGKLMVDWYFHLYVITNRKILDVSYSPFFSKNITAVSLDQVRCIETSVKIQGPLETYLDIGDVTLHLDMLTHESTFVLPSIGTAHKIGVSIGDRLNAIIATRSQSSTFTASLQQDENNIIGSYNLPVGKSEAQLTTKSGQTRRPGYTMIPRHSLGIG